MKFKKYFFYSIFLTFYTCHGQENNIHLSDLKFKSIFGTDSKDSFRTYCLLGTGFFRAPFSKNADSLISGWMQNHPDAEVILVSTLDEPKHKMTYCWLVDKGDTINNYMIKRGCYPGGTMMRPQTYEEMSAKMKAVYNNVEKPNIKVHIDKKSYDKFIEQIKAAETFAETNKLGIWDQKKDDE